MHDLEILLAYLKLPYIRENYESVAATAARNQWTHIHFLSELTTVQNKLKFPILVF